MPFTTERKKRGYEWRWWPRKRDNAFLLQSLKRGRLQDGDVTPVL
jgi:hypothetical protein